MSGSHIDAVPAAGRFDGILGVVGALEGRAHAGRAASGIEASLRGRHLPRGRGHAVWRCADRQQSLGGDLGSQQLAAMHDRAGTSYLAAMETYGLRAADLERQRFRPGHAKAILELHIEQSVVLEEYGVQFGAVTTITGIRSFEVTLRGVANHAGATPMDRRCDALAGAAEIILALERMAPTLGHHTVCTVGQISCHPGARNVIPGEVRFSIDFRDVEGLDTKWSRVNLWCERLPALATWQWSYVRCPPANPWRCRRPSRAYWSRFVTDGAFPLCGCPVEQSRCPR